MLDLHRQNENPSIESSISMLEMKHKCNNFRFNDEYYFQINGTVMGTRVSLTYANIFIDAFKSKFIYSHSLCPRVWLRFMDDIGGLLM